MTNFSAGSMLLERLCAVLDIQGPVSRLVIDVPVDGVAQVYVQQYLDESKGRLEDVLAAAKEDGLPRPEIVEAKSVEIDAFGRVWTGE